MDEIRPLTSLSQDELVARIEQYEEVVQLRDAEICNLNEALDNANAGRGALRAAGELESVYEAFGIGAGAREPHILRHNIENVKRRADCLNAIEREFFMVRGEPDEDYPGCEPDDECLLRWGDDPSSYIERFRAALDRIRPVESADRKRRGEPVSEETLWCLHILGPDDVYPAPSRAYAEVAADVHNARFRKISKESGVMCEAIVAPWPHDAESHARGLANFVSNWIAPQPAETEECGCCGHSNGCAPDCDTVRTAESAHNDDIAVDAFAAAMKAKLAKKRADGRGNWEACSAGYLSRFLLECAQKGDPVDVANLAMMLHQNGQKIVPAEPVKVPSETEYVDPLVRALGWEDHGGTPPATLTAQGERHA